MGVTKVSIWKPVVASGMLILCFLSITAYGVTCNAGTVTVPGASTADIHNVVHMAIDAGLQSVFVPASKSPETPRNAVTGSFVSHESNGIVIIESSKYRIMESAQKISMDTPNEQERLSESINGSHNVTWSTYLLPGGSAQHILSLQFDGLWVSIVPKWTSSLPGNGGTTSQEHRNLSVQDLQKVVTMAKSLHRIQVDL
jgi:hypothetical protein